MRRLWSSTKKMLFWTFFVSLFLLTTITVVLHVYEDEIKQYAIDAINEHLKKELQVQSIELSFFHDFPNASLEFKNVLIRDAFENQESNDTLLFAKKTFCTFNIWDIWNEDYKVKRIDINESKLNLKVNSKGEVNYDIFKDSEDTTETSFTFNLELLKVEKCRFNYSNLATGQYYGIDVGKALVRGDFTAEQFEIETESELYIRKLKSNSLTLVRNKPAHLDLMLDVDLTKNLYTFKKGDIQIGKMPFEVKGYVDTNEIDLSVQGKDIQLQDLANSLAAGTFPDAPRYEGTGILNFISEIKGPISSVNMPSVTAEFDLENGTLVNPSNMLKANDIDLKGTYQNKQDNRDEILSFSDFNLKLLDSYFKGNATIENFEQPFIKSIFDGDMNLETFHRFFRFPGVDKISGKMNVNLNLDIQFFDPEYRAEKFKISKSTGTLKLQNLTFKQIGEDLNYRDISGEVVVLNNDAAVKDFSIKTDLSDMMFNGALNNIMQYVSGFGDLGIVATVESKSLNLDEFIVDQNEIDETNPEKFELPQKIHLNLDFNATEILWDGHRFESSSGKLIMSNRKAELNNFKLNTLGGSVSGNLTLNNADHGNLIESKMHFNKVDVKTLFSEWKNFDQETITDKHISGKGSGDITLLLAFNPYFSIIEEKIYALCALEITDGKLDELETMRLITDYMRSNNALKLMLNKHIDQFEQKLMHLSFKTLSNTIEIKDRKIYIPKMIIESNALRVELFGWHDFDNNVEYHFSFRFRELKSVPEYTEFGKIEDDGLGIIIYLTMYGSIDEPQFALDKDERKNDIKESLAEENETLKSMLKTEFGLFKKDSTVQTHQQNNSKQVEFIFYDEEEDPVDTTATKTKNKERSGKFFNKLKEDSKKEKESEEVEFGEDL